MDSPQKIKAKQMVLFFGGIAGFIFILTFGMWLSDPNRGKPSAMEKKKVKENEIIKKYGVNSRSALTDEENWIAKSEEELGRLTKENQQLKKQLEILTNKFQRMEEDKKEGTQNPAALDQSYKNSSFMNGSLPVPYVVKQTVEKAIVEKVENKKSQTNSSEDQEKRGGIKVLDLTNDSSKNVSKDKNASHYLPTGTFATAVLMSGIDAPTGGMAQQNPMPIIMRVMDNGQMPNFFKSEIKDCHATGAAYGDISSERGMIRLETIACVLVNGDVLEASLKGFVTGEDGKAGFRGKLISKQGSLIAKSALAGIFSGMGNAISQQYQQISTNALGTVQSMNPNKVMEAGLATGTSRALEKIADFYIARANETYPIIEVDAGRIGEIVLTAGTNFKKKIVGKTNKERG